jgi:hypothetical protein
MKPIIPILGKKFAERFWSHVNRDQNCWIWNGNKDRQGYGIVRARPRLYRAPRVAWVIANGLEIPEGMMVCHRCDNPSCVNPSHLFLGSNDENIHDKVGKNRQSHARNTGSKGEKHPRARLSEKDVMEIRAKYQPFLVTAKMLAKEFDISEREIRSIIYRENWSHI